MIRKRIFIAAPLVATSLMSAPPLPYLQASMHLKVILALPC